MSSKSKKGSKGKARAHAKTDLPTPPASEVGRVIGKALAEVLTRKAKASPGLARNAEISNPLLRPENRAARQALPSLDVRTPDSQQITWGFRSRRPNDCGPYDDPLVTRISFPESAYWTWTVSKHLIVSAALDYSAGGYLVRVISAVGGVTSMKGTGAEAKKLAEALLSASDWEQSWKKVMGEDWNDKRWQDYGTA